MPVSRAQFVSLCATATSDTFRSFVAGLYEARGRAVERAGDHLVVATDARARRVAVLDETAWTGIVPADADAAVVAADLDDPGPAVTDVVDLHRQLLYAVDRTDAAALLEVHFDRPPSSLESPTGSVGAGADSRFSTASGHETEIAGDGDGAGSRRLYGSSAPAVVAVVFAGCLLVAGILVAVGGLAAGGAESAPGPQTTPVTPTSAETTSTAVVATATPSERRTPVSPELPEERDPVTHVWAEPSRVFPPGITVGGIGDETELIEAHRSTLADNSYQLTLTYREFVDGTTSGVYRERIRVANGTRYAVSTTQTGEFRSGPRRIALTDVFADGSARFERTDEGTRVERVSDVDPFLDDVARYLGWYLSVRNATIEAPGRDGGGLYRITTQGDPYPGVRNATGTAFVTDRGLIRDIRRSHERSSADVRVVVRMRVTGVGETAVRRPPWADEAQIRDGQSQPDDG